MYEDNQKWTKAAEDFLGDLRSFVLPKQSKSGPGLSKADFGFIARIWAELYWDWDPHSPGGRSRRLNFLNDRELSLVQISQYLFATRGGASDSLKESFVQDIVASLEIHWKGYTK